MANARQLNFSGGELAPSLYGRVDQVKYATGLRTCRNFMIQRHGGVQNRPGTQFIAEVKTSSSPVRLMKFVFNDDQTYVLEVGDQYIRFFRNRARITVSGVAAWATATAYSELGTVRSNGGVNYVLLAAHTSAAGNEPGVGSSWQTYWYALTSTIYELPSPYAAADVMALQYVQDADVVTIVHPSYPPHELTRYDHARWTLLPITFGPQIAAPTGLALSGGNAGAIHYWKVTAIDADTLEESLAGTVSATNRVPSSGTPTVVTWTPVANAVESRIYRSTDGATYGLVGTVGGTGVTATDTAWTDNTEAAATSSTGAWIAAAGQCRNPLVLTPTKAVDGRYLVYGRITLAVAGGTTSYAIGRVRGYYQRNTDAARVDAGIITPSNFRVFTSGTNGPVAFVGTITVPDDGYTGLTIDLVPEVFLADVLSGVPNASMTCDVTTAPNDRIDWTSSVGSFSDAAGDADFTQEPPRQLPLFDSEDNYPSAVSYYQQRQAFAGTDTKPQTSWLSRIGSFKSFVTSTPLQDDDAISFTLVGRKVSRIHHLLDVFGRLVIGTSSGAYTVGGDEAGILTPSAINPQQRSYHGIHETMPPLIVGTTVLYVQERGSIVRDLFREAAEDYTGNDLTIFSAHLFEGHELLDWDYQENPHSILWIVRDDGVLLGLTYLREQAIWGWHRHDTEGLFENVCVVPEGTEDAVYLCVNRTINGATKRYIEAFASRVISEDTQDEMFFVDSGLTYDGWNAGAATMQLSGGTNWTTAEHLTLGVSDGSFVVGDIGKSFLLEDPDTGERVTFLADVFLSADELEGFTNKTVPTELRNAPVTTWARMASTVTGLSHLNGETVSVLGDGFVEASALRPDYDEITVAGGSITLARPYAMIHVGLPYIADLETLDITDPPHNKKNVTAIAGYFEKTRGIFMGRQPPTDDEDDPLERLIEFKRSVSSDIEFPDNLVTELRKLNIQATQYDFHGRVFLRQIDPLPATVLSLEPTGFD
jgi:hypothetical protein